MKYILSIAIILTALSCWGSPFLVSDKQVGVTSYQITGFLWCQNAEGAGYDNSETWNEGGTVDEDYTTVVLRGSQSISIADSSYTAFSLAGDTTELYAFGRFRFTDATPSAVDFIFKVLHDAADAGGLRVNTNGTLNCINGTVTNNAASALSNDTTYYIWIYYKANTGADDGILTAEVSTTRVYAEATAALGCSVTTGNDADPHATVVRYTQSAAGGLGLVVDQLLGKATAIGDVCQ